jgi:hypothetical protein
MPWGEGGAGHQSPFQDRSSGEHAHFPLLLGVSCLLLLSELFRSRRLAMARPKTRRARARTRAHARQRAAPAGILSWPARQTADEGAALGFSVTGWRRTRSVRTRRACRHSTFASVGCCSARRKCALSAGLPPPAGPGRLRALQLRPPRAPGGHCGHCRAGQAQGRRAGGAACWAGPGFVRPIQVVSAVVNRPGSARPLHLGRSRSPPPGRLRRRIIPP